MHALLISINVDLTMSPSK